MKRTRPLLLLAALLALFAAACGGGGSKSSSSTASTATSTSTTPASTGATTTSVPTAVECPKTKAVPADAVALVCGTGITRAQLDQLLQQAKQSYKAQKRTFPDVGSSEYATLRDQAIAYLVQRAEYAQEAKQLGLDVTDDQVTKRLAAIKKQYYNGDEKKYQQALKAQGVSDTQVRDDIKAQLTNEAIVKKVTASVNVTDAQITQYYSQHQDQYTQPQSRRVRHILVKSKALADKLYTQLKGGADFAALAKKYSQDPGSKQVGGVYTDSKGTFVPQFEKVAFSLKTNELSKPVHTQYGWHLIQALGPITPAKKTPFSKVKDQIRQQLLQTNKSDATTSWVNAVKSAFAGDIVYQTGYAPATTAASTG